MKPGARSSIEGYTAELRQQLSLALRVPQAHPGLERIVGELRAHFEDAVADRLQDGATPAEAMSTAIGALGSPRAIAQGYRVSGAPRFAQPEPGDAQTRLTRLMEMILRTFREGRLAWRGLARSPGYVAAFVLTLGLGIGANTAIFSVVRGIWLRPLPHADGDRLVYLRHSSRAVGGENVFFSVPEIEDIRERARSFEGVVEFSTMTFTVQGLDQPRRIAAGVVTANYFEVMGLSAIEGRVIASRDDGETAAPVAILTDKFWTQVFGGDPGVVGRVVRMNGRGVEIVGVLEPAPPYPEHTDMYVNMVASPHHLGASMTQDRLHRMTEVFARLAPGATAQQAGVEIDEIARRLHVEYPDAYDRSQGYQITVTPLREQLASRAAPTALVLLAVTCLVLIIACANVANLTLARVMRRQGELAIRVSLGASAWRIRRQLLVESLIPSVAGAVLGSVIAYASVDLLATYAARYSARASEIAVDGVVLSGALLAALLAAVLFALLPPLPGASSRALRPQGARVAGGGSGRRVQRLLVVSQVAVCCVLLVGAGLLLRTLYNLQKADGGLELEEVLTVEMPAAPNRSEPGQLLTYFQTILEQASSLPGVRSAAFGSRVPLRGLPSGPIAGLAAMEFEFEDQPIPAGAPMPRGDFRPVSPGYFETVGLTLRSGRVFDEADRRDAKEVVIINQALAERHFGDRDPVGQQLGWRGYGLRYMGVSEDWREIVGVVSNSNDNGMTEAPPQIVFQPLAQVAMASTLLVRTDKPAAAAAPLVSIVRNLEPEQPIVRVATLAEIYEEEIGPQRLNALLVGIFALLALVIAAVGVGGVLAFGVSQRVPELGVRAALGASRQRLLTMVIAEGGVLAAIGLAIGGAVALAGSRLVGGLLFGVTGTDVLTFAAAALVMMGVSVSASLAPAWRASTVDPARALRME